MSITKRLALALLLAAASTIALAAAAVDGKWATEAPGPRGNGVDKIVMEFKSAGSKLTGTIVRTDPPGQKPVALEGTIDKDVVTFTVKSPDGNRTITFTGTVKGDEITFKREVKGTGGGQGFYGLHGPATLTAKRVK
jgi:hypothetical protein